MQNDIRTISLSSSDLSWDDVDEHAESIGFKERSKYIQYLVEKDIHKTKRDYSQILIIFLLLFLAMMSLVIMLRV